MERGEAECLELSEGEAFFVLEDMFGGLLPPEILDKVFVESSQNLEEAVVAGFRACQALWGRGEGALSPNSSFLSDATTTDAMLARCSSSAEDDDFDEFADVSDWTEEQAIQNLKSDEITLTELCLAFEETPRESVVVALTASNHDPSAAAQLLLELQEAPGGRGGRRRWPRKEGQRAGKRGRGGGARRDRTRALLGVGGGRSGGGGGGGDERGRGGGNAEEEGAEEEEEDGDQGLTSEEYRALADEAAEEMKAWFQKAAEAFTKGGRNGGAAATHPALVGQRWKKKMEAINLRAARQTFRERNPLVRVGYTTVDAGAVLKVLALPEPFQCPSRGRLSIDLHLLRKTEALSVLDAVLYAVRRRRTQTLLPSRSAPPPAGTTMMTPHATQRSVSAETRVATGATGGDVLRAAGAGAGVGSPSAVGGVEEGFMEAFTALEVVVGRGAHSKQGVARLRPAVARHLAGRGFRAEALGGGKGEGVVVVSLSGE
ncbi:unnamed protein product [Laminaria digitata]